MSSSSQISESLSPSEMLYSNLAQGIHAVAQPLAVLMASLGKAHTDLMNLDELRELTARSAAQVERACSLFGCLQQLVMAESIKPQLSPTFLTLDNTRLEYLTRPARIERRVDAGGRRAL